MYPAAHPYHHTVIGSKADLDAASLEDVKRWFRTWYGPNNTVLVLAGDIDLATAREKVTRYFGDIPASPTIPMPKAWVAERARSGRATMLDHVAQPRIYKVWNVPEFGNDDEARLELLAQVLGGGTSSRLNARLVLQDKLADHVTAYVDSNELGSNFVVYVDVKKAVDPAKVEAILGEELQHLLREGPTAEEIERARAVFRAGFIRGIERIGGFGGKADVLAQCAVYTGDPGCFRRSQGVYESATPAQIAASGSAWLNKGDWTLLVKPVPAGAAPPTVPADSTAGEPYATKDQPVPAIDPKFSVVASDVDRSKGVPEPASFPDLKFPVLQHATLKNGMTVILAERHEIPIVQLDMTFKGGFAADQGHKLGTSSFTMAMLDKGAGPYDTIEIGRREERLGAYINSGASLDGSSILLGTLKENLDPAMALFSQVLLHPCFDPMEIQRVRKTWIADIAQEKTQPLGVALRLLPPLLYGEGHPYAMPFSGTGTEASINSLTREDLVAFDRRWLRPDNATLIVVGDTTLDEITPLLEKHFGEWKAPAGAAATVDIKPVPPQTQPRVFLVDQPGAIQSNILVGQVVPSTLDPKHVDFDLANGILGGQFSSRLNMNLREGKHWAYGSYSFNESAVGQQPWIAYAPVQIDKTTDAILEVQREVTEYANGKAPATAEELARVKAINIRSLPGAFETGYGVLGAIADMATYHRPDDYVQTEKQRIESVPLEAAREAARELHPESLTWVIVGDLSKIEQGVRKLDLGDVRVVDGDGKPLTARAKGKPAGR